MPLRASPALADRVGRRVRRGAKELARGFLGEALAADERSRLGVFLYDRSDRYRSLEAPSWEEAWLRRHLPPSRSRVLVGACGAGREVLALLERGYEVVGFEPARSMAELARVRVGSRAAIYVLRYEELAADILDGRSGGGAAFTSGPFDAVLLGWGSLSHVLDADERGRLIDALGVICPTGPILASFLQVPPAGLPSPGRAQRLGSRLGGLARLIRRRRIPREDRSCEIAHDDLGFTHVFVPAELEALAQRVGRRALFNTDELGGSGTAAFVLP